MVIITNSDYLYRERPIRGRVRFRQQSTYEERGRERERGGMGTGDIEGPV